MEQIRIEIIKTCRFNGEEFSVKAQSAPNQPIRFFLNPKKGKETAKKRQLAMVRIDFRFIDSSVRIQFTLAIEISKMIVPNFKHYGFA